MIFITDATGNDLTENHHLSKSHPNAKVYLNKKYTPPKSDRLPYECLSPVVHS